MPAHKKSDLTARIVEMRKTMKASQIAKELGLSEAAVFYHLRKPNKVLEGSGESV